MVKAVVNTPQESSTRHERKSIAEVKRARSSARITTLKKAAWNAAFLH